MEFCKEGPAHVSIFLPTEEKEDRVMVASHVTIYLLTSLTLSQSARKGKGVGNRLQKEITEGSEAFYAFLVKFLQEQTVDAVIAQNIHVGLPASYNLLINMACRTHNVPLYLQLHSFAATDLQSQIINSLFWKKILCVSKSVAGDTFHKGAASAKITTKYLGVHTDEFTDQQDMSWLKNHLGLTSDQSIILCASRILRGYSDILQEKGIIDLIDAFSTIVRTRPTLRLLLAVGKPPAYLAAEFEDALKKLDGYIQIHGVQNQVIVQTFPLEDMPRVYAGADVFVLASENETFGQVFIESMASGTPVIGTKVGGIPEIITDGQNGFLVNPGDTSALAKKILLLFDDADLQSSFIKNGKQTTEKRFSASSLFGDLFRYIRQDIQKTPLN